YEQDAGFIEISIPLIALGLTNGCGAVKIGAVVGGPGFCTSPGNQNCFIDSGYLGLSMAGWGTNRVEIEGVTVDLGSDLDQDGDGLSDFEEKRLGTDPKLVDSDNDGLADGYEVRFGLDPLSGEGPDGGCGDPDGDCATNAQEFVAGTDPRDPTSIFKIEACMINHGEVLIKWRVVPGRRYRLEAARSADGSFEPVPGYELPRKAESTVIVHIESVPQGSDRTARFYRVVVWP
ncbi:MAG: thrombospondin type 3 repeat-containing protein, partial [Verrucomicrobiae bacterium]|nr:thrombospondin type 3 repeat-containing protein [Verrucomicrobiae bacterium]